MNRPICVDKRTVQPAGNGVQVNPTTDASQNGCSVMEKMIVEMVLTSYPNIVQNVIQKLNSSVAITDAYQSEFIFLKNLNSRTLTLTF